MKHEIIYTEKYALIVSDEKIKEGDLFINIKQKELYCHNIENYDVDKDYLKKVIGHRPLKMARVIEGVPLLPEFSSIQPDRNKELYYQKQVMNPYSTGGQSYTAYEKGFIEGWSKSKETYKYSEEDMRKVIEISRSQYWDPDNGGFSSNPEGDWSYYLEDQIIQSIQHPELPKYFQCEIETIEEYRDKMGNVRSEKKFLKTVTKTKGQTELVGEYI